MNQVIISDGNVRPNQASLESSVFGNIPWTFSYTEQNRGRGNIFYASDTFVIAEIQHYLNPLSSGDLYWFVYEGSSQKGSYTLKYSKTVFSGTGMAWYSSGSVNYTVNTGKYYAIGVWWGARDVTYGSGGLTPVVAPGYGILTTGIGGSLSGGIPPATVNLNYNVGYWLIYPGKLTGAIFSSGYLESSVLNAGVPNTDWNTISWSENLPLNTDITFATRTGNTPVPDGSWSSWSAELTFTGSLITSPDGRYIQYRTTLVSINGLSVPLLSDVTIFYTSFSPCTVTPTKNADTPGKEVKLNSKNISVLAFRVTDNFNHSIKTIRINNNGNMEDGIDISEVKLWQDVNGDFKWDSGDILINSSGIWTPTTLTWDFEGLNIAQDTDLIVTIDPSYTGREGKTFLAGMFYANVLCNNNGVNNNIINNINSIILLPYYSMFPDIYGVFPTKFNPNENNVARIFFGGETLEAEIKIYDVLGNLIRYWSKDKTIEKEVIEWDGKDDNGKDVNAGIYIIYIKGENVEKNLKMMLVK